MHSDIATIERMELIRDLRLGEYDVFVGINLLREGLDLPEVSLVAILDADKEGFLAQRDEPDPDDRPRRAQRRWTGHPLRRHNYSSMRAAMDETERRRKSRTTITARTASSPRRSARTCARCWRFPRAGGRAPRAEEDAHRRRARGDHPPPRKGDEGGQQDAGIRIRGCSERSDYRAARREIREVFAVPPRRGFECAGVRRTSACRRQKPWNGRNSLPAIQMKIKPTGTASGEIRGCSERSDYRAARREIREVSAMPPRRGFECAGSPAYNSQFLNSFPS